MRQKELQDEEEKILNRREISSSSSIRGPSKVEYCLTEEPSFPSTAEGEEIVCSQEPCASSARPRQNREDEFHLDLEDIMVMEAIWLSIQESGRHQNPPYSKAAASEECTGDDRTVSAWMAPVAVSSPTPSGGLACAIATLAEHQQVGGESSSNYGGHMSTYSMPRCSIFSTWEQESGNFFPAESAIFASPGSQLAMPGDSAECRSEVTEVGTSYSVSAAVPQQVEGEYASHCSRFEPGQVTSAPGVA